MSITIIFYSYGYGLGCRIECPAVSRRIGFGNCVFVCACFSEFDLTEVDRSTSGCAHRQCCRFNCRCRCAFACFDREFEGCFLEAFAFNSLCCKDSSCCFIVCINDYRFCFIAVGDLCACYRSCQMTFTIIINRYSYGLGICIKIPSVRCCIGFFNGVFECTGLCECDLTEVDRSTFGCAHRQCCRFNCRCRCFTDCLDCEFEGCFLEAFAFNCLLRKYCSCSFVVCIDDYRFCFIAVGDRYTFNSSCQMTFTVVLYSYDYGLVCCIECPAVRCCICFSDEVCVRACLCECDLTEVDRSTSGCAHRQCSCSGYRYR